MSKPVAGRQSFALHALGFLLSASVVLFAAPPSAHAQQTYPNRPVRLIIPFGPGGIADITSRLVAERLGERLGRGS
jgi:tripartite-type tricarboxylate transporter receptor subunit TctC